MQSSGTRHLDGNQLASWNPKLADTLVRHRRDELPYLAAFFDGFLKATREGLKTTNTSCLIDAFEGLYRRQFRLASGVAAPLLASLHPSQIRALEAKFAEDARKAARKSGSPSAQRLRKRAERWSKSAVWWIGPLNGEQRGIIREVTAALPNTSAAWAAYRKDRQAGLIRLLDGRAGEARIRRYLTDWLAYHRNLTPPLRKARREIRRQLVRLFMRLDASFSPTQRAHFKDRLTKLRDDFMKIQKSPRMVPLRCAKSGR